MPAACVAMGRFWLGLFLLVTMQLTTLATIAQEYGEAISAENLHRLRSDEHIDFADIDAELEIGWFAANDSATELVVFRQSGETYSISAFGVSRRWPTNWEQGDRLFALIDAVYLQGEPMVLHLLDEQYFINENPLTTGYIPVALFHGLAADDLFVEAIAADGQTRFLHFRREGATGDLRLQDVIPYPNRANDEPVMRIGRIDFPVVVMSSLADNILDFRLYPDFFSEQNARLFQLENGPAVFGAVNWPAASHLAWSDPYQRSTQSSGSSDRRKPDRCGVGWRLSAVSRAVAGRERDTDSESGFRKRDCCLECRKRRALRPGTLQRMPTYS